MREHNTSRALDSIDSAAEREAEAIERLAELTDEPVPQPRLQQIREQARCAALLRLPAVKHPRYQRERAVRAWCVLVDTFRAGRIPQPKRNARYVETRADRDRQALRRLERLAILHSLTHLRKPLSIPEAAELTDSGTRTIERALTTGELPRIRNGRRVTVRPADLKQYLSRRVRVPV